MTLFWISNACHLASLFALITGHDKKKGTDHRPVHRVFVKNWNISIIGDVDTYLYIHNYIYVEGVIQSCTHTLS